MRGLFVTSTDTGVGKSVVAAAICATLAARGEDVAAFKPAVTGLDAPEGDWPPDHVLLARAAGGRQAPCDLAVDLALPLVIAARTGLGTINHTLLTVEAARAAGLRVAGVVMTPWPAAPVPIEVSNRATVERLAGVRVSGLPTTEWASLAQAGSALPLDDWL